MNTPPSDLATLLGRMRAQSASITLDRPFPASSGPLAPLKRAVRKVIAKAARWYVEPVAVDVRRFADTAIQVSQQLRHEQEIASATAADVERRLTALADRLGRLERGRAAGALRAAETAPETAAAPPQRDAAPTSAQTPSTEVPFDYFAFEALMRGSRAEIMARQRAYLDAFGDADDILDAGCGRGEFLAILREAGKTARGVDLDADMVEQCRAEGLDATRGDVIAHLRSLPAGSLGGVFSAQLVEHLPPAALTAFIAACADAIRPGGVLILETINPTSLSALRHYFADLTHAQPLVPETLAFLVESAGFRDVRIEYTSPVPEAARLGRVPFAGAVPVEAQAAADRNVDLVNGILFAPLDYAVVARA